MQLGIVTYMIAARWSLTTILERLEELGIFGVELRGGHAHGVEDDLKEEERQRIHKRFEASPVELVGLGTAFEFDSPDPDILKQNIQGTKRYIELAHDVGALGVKVRPNRLHTGKGIPAHVTLRQIGESLAELGEYGQRYGVRLRLEVHGPGTSLLSNVRTILRQANHPNVFVCWNCNSTDLDNPAAPIGRRSIRRNFELVEQWIEILHLHELWDPAYPYAELFRLLRARNFEGYTLAEIPACACDEDAVRLLRYYRALWEKLASQGAE
jgi:hypothetical protein